MELIGLRTDERTEERTAYNEGTNASQRKNGQCMHSDKGSVMIIKPWFRLKRVRTSGMRALAIAAFRVPAILL